MRKYLAVLLLPLLYISCTESTSSIGMFPETDGIVNSNALYNVYTKSILLDSVIYKSTYNYLGNINDPETDVVIKANFAAQFHTFENYKFPNKNLLFSDYQNNHSQDPVKCDSIELRLFYNGYYGDPNNPMKLEVYPLSFNKIIEEDSIYYVNTDLEKFVDDDAEPIVTKIFTAIDYSVSESVREGDNYSSNIRISLPKEYGNKLLNAYYDHPEYYKNSYSFIRNVCPGFYFKIKSGTGTMINVEVSTLNLYFTYHDPNTQKSVAGLCRFAATPEVIQSTQFTNGDMQGLVDDNNCTYLKSPAGIGTEITLPINEIFAGHETDSISKVELTLTRYNNKNTDSKYALDIPQNVVMVRKDNMVSFFKDKKLPDSQTSFYAPFDNTYNTYTFDNLGRLITYCHYERMTGIAEMKKAGVEQAEEKWEEEHPNWNKVVIIPVSIIKTTDAYGNTTYSNITHDMSMTSTRLIGGPNNPIKLQILYSRFQ